MKKCYFIAISFTYLPHANNAATIITRSMSPSFFLNNAINITKYYLIAVSKCLNEELYFFVLFSRSTKELVETQLSFVYFSNHNITRVEV